MNKRTFYRMIFFLSLIASRLILAQTCRINGNISTPIIPVKNADVIFIDDIDTTKKYSTQTDGLGNYQLNLITSVHGQEVTLPTKFELAQNYPNPFSNETAITYELSEPADAEVKIYNILGQEIKTFNVGGRYTGTHRIKWDGKDNFGKRSSTGIYFYMLQAEKEALVKKIIFGLGSAGLSHLNFMMQSDEKSLNTAQAQTSNQLLKSNSNLFRIRIINSDNTQPQIYNQVLENIVIQRDTTINFVVDVVGPWREIKTEVTWLRDIDFPDSVNGWAVGSNVENTKDRSIILLYRKQ
jgi:flagellar hook assembly protein FlgD